MEKFDQLRARIAQAFQAPKAGEVPGVANTPLTPPVELSSTTTNRLRTRRSFLAAAGATAALGVSAVSAAGQEVSEEDPLADAGTPEVAGEQTTPVEPPVGEPPATPQQTVEKAPATIADEVTDKIGNYRFRKFDKSALTPEQRDKAQNEEQEMAKYADKLGSTIKYYKHSELIREWEQFVQENNDFKMTENETSQLFPQFSFDSSLSAQYKATSPNVPPLSTDVGTITIKGERFVAYRTYIKTNGISQVGYDPARSLDPALLFYEVRQQQKGWETAVRNRQPFTTDVQAPNAGQHAFNRAGALLRTLPILQELQNQGIPSFIYGPMLPRYNDLKGKFPDPQQLQYQFALALVDMKLVTATRDQIPVPAQFSK